MIGFYAHPVKSDITIDKVRLSILTAMNAYGRMVEKAFKETVSTWDEEVEFIRLKAFNRSGRMEVLVYTDNQIYQWVDQGTPEHDIWAGIYTGKSNELSLSFFMPSIPKTKPNVLSSGIGNTGTEHILTPYVHHPGIKARNFDKNIAKQMKPIFRQMMQEAIVLALADLGAGTL